MSLMFFTPNDVFAYLDRQARSMKGKYSVDIASYGMYIGITTTKDWHETFPSQARAFIETIKTRRHRILIGLPYYASCHENCLDCARRFNDTLRRHALVQAKLDLNLRFNPALHLKYYRVGKVVVSGGINLTASKSLDISLTVEEAHHAALQNFFDSIWRSSTNDITAFLKPES